VKNYYFKNIALQSGGAVQAGFTTIEKIAIENFAQVA
jgi:hypothetical protein